MREELRAGDDGADHFPDITVGAPERPGSPLNELRRWRIAHEAACQLERDIPRGGRMPRNDVEHVLTILDAATRRELVAEHDLRSRVVHLRIESELSTALLRTREGPAGERARDIYHVLLRIAAVDAKRVELEQLAAVVLVQPAAAGARYRCQPGAVAVRLAFPVVQIE